MVMIIIILVLLAGLILTMSSLLLTYNTLFNLEEGIQKEIEEIKNILCAKLELVDEFNKYIKLDFDLIEKAYELKEKVETTYDVENLVRYNLIVEVLFKEIEGLIDMENRHDDIDIKKLLLVRNSLKMKLKEKILNLNEYISEYNELLDTFMGRLIKSLSDFQEKDFYEDI
ncbi:MAG: hypothetical protein DSY59_04825 [Persephonella sp.]|nr:MAG: hypothetical protein DSY59_04825 [Persephonella sp.]